MTNYRDKIARAIAEHQSCGYCEGTCQECLGEADAIMPIMDVAIAEARAETAEAIARNLDFVAREHQEELIHEAASYFRDAANIARDYTSNGGR